MRIECATEVPTQSNRTMDAIGKPQDALCGWLSLAGFAFGIFIALGGPFGASGGDATGVFEVLKTWAIGLAVCFTGFVFAILGFFRRERPGWPAALGFCLGLFSPHKPATSVAL